MIIPDDYIYFNDTIMKISLKTEEDIDESKTNFVWKLL
jgi:hypothetical protein